MPKKSSIALFIAATSALSISTSVNSGENDMGGLKEWNTDMDVNADFILDDKAQEIEDKAKNATVTMKHFEEAVRKVREQKDLKMNEKLVASYYR